MTKRHVVQPGECLSSIAYEHGFFSETLWKAGDNAGLKRVRAEPNLLVPGDVVTIPARREKSGTGPTDTRTQFRRRGVPARLHLTFVEEGEPCADTPYVVVVDGQRHEGVTDGAGNVSVTISPAARHAQLVLGEGDDAIVYEFKLGHLRPGDDDAGVRARLENLGHSCGGETAPLGPRTAAALRSFQGEQGLDPSGELDAPTRARLLEKHGT
jgi:hypothetical protein